MLEGRKGALVGASPTASSTHGSCAWSQCPLTTAQREEVTQSIHQGQS